MLSDIDSFIQEVDDHEAPGAVEVYGDQAECQRQEVTAQQHQIHQARGARKHQRVDAGLGRVHIKRRR